MCIIHSVYSDVALSRRLIALGLMNDHQQTLYSLINQNSSTVADNPEYQAVYDDLRIWITGNLFRKLFNLRSMKRSGEHSTI